MVDYLASPPEVLVFQVKFDFDQTTGQCISTAVTLTIGGAGYFVGDNISIAGTHLVVQLRQTSYIPSYESYWYKNRCSDIVS